MLGKSGLLLVQINGNQLEMNGSPGLKFQQNIEHGVTVFAPRNTHHDAVTFFNHVEVHNGLAHQAAKPFLKFVHLTLMLGARCM